MIFYKPEYKPKIKYNVDSRKNKVLNFKKNKIIKIISIYDKNIIVKNCIKYLIDQLRFYLLDSILKISFHFENISIILRIMNDFNFLLLFLNCFNN